MKSSTLSSFSVLVETFLKYTPAFLPTIESRIRGCSCAAGRAASATPTIQRPASAGADASAAHQEARQRASRQADLPGNFHLHLPPKSAILQSNTISDQP